MLPSLTGLDLTAPRPRRDLLAPAPPSGVYCLDKLDATEPCDSSVVLVRNALPARPGEFAELATFMRDEVRQETMMGNRVPRKQCTFGPVQYKQYQLISDENRWPSLVTRALEATRALAAQMGDPHPEEYNSLQANYYADEDDSVIKHTDAEPELVPGAPIFSFTWILEDDNEAARPFSIWRMSGEHAKHIDLATHHKSKSRLVDLTLYSGDLLVMRGEMQRFFNHSIEKRLAERAAPRLNLTARKKRSRKEAMAQSRGEDTNLAPAAKR